MKPVTGVLPERVTDSVNEVQEVVGIHAQQISEVEVDVAFLENVPGYLLLNFVLAVQIDFVRLYVRRETDQEQTWLSCW